MINRFLYTKNIPILFAAIVLCSSLASAQEVNVQLNWAAKANRIETINGVFERISFEGANHTTENKFYPTFSKMFDVKGEVKAEIRNAVYTSVEKLAIADLPLLKDVPVLEVVNAKAAARNVAIVSVSPFRINEATGETEKLVSFTLSLSTSNKVASQLSASRGANSYAQNSVLKSGAWHRVAVSKTAIHKLTYTFVKTKFGVEPANISFTNFGVFGNYSGLLPEIAGQTPNCDDLKEMPVHVSDKNGNGKFDSDDYVLFFGQSPHTWSYPGSNKPFTHTKHLYSDENFYFITSTNGTGKNAPIENNPGAANYTATTFNDFAFHENDEKNYLESGRLWLGDRMSATKTSVDVDFNFPNLVTSSPVTIFSAATGRSTATTSSNAVILKVNQNGNQIFQHGLPGVGGGSYGSAASYGTATTSIAPTSDNIKLTYNYSSIDNAAEAMIDYVEVNCLRALKMSGSDLVFRSISSIEDARISEFKISDAGNVIVWDVTNPIDAKQQQVSYNSGFVSFNATTSSLKEFVAFNPDGSFSEPVYVTSVANQDLHAVGEPNMVIVTHPDFVPAANKLANFHKQHQNLNALVVTPQTIYNEFSSGKQDVSAIRNFMKMLFDRAAGDTNLIPKYLLLFGDGSFDMVNRTSAGDANFIPTFQSHESLAETVTFVSDDYYVLLEDGKGGTTLRDNDLLDAAVGRLPVSTVAEADGIVEKIITYKSPASLGNWRNTTTFIADDEDYNIHIKDADEIAEIARVKYPVYNFNKIYLDAYQRVNTPAGARYPDVNIAIINAMNKGTLIMNYVGHGGVSNWAHERVFNMNDIQQFKNKTTLPLFVTATCEFSKFDKSGGQTAGEVLINNPNGGAIALITTVRLVYSSQNYALNSALFKYIFEPYHGQVPTMGELLSSAKNSINKDANNRKFLLLGDPALKLNYPQLNVVTTEVNGNPVGMNNDTLKALQQATIKGEVRNWNGTIASDFNGVVYPTVYDKISTLTTLKNAGSSSKMDFKIYRNTLFNGKSSVTNGEFSFSFIVPKDIDYQVSKGRISYYADNLVDIDAHGFEHSINVGSSVDSVGFDDEGPKVTLFMNDERFRDGGITDANPNLLALLEDDYGINLGNGLGHEITAVLDEYSEKPIVLNDYFESELNSYRKGKVMYPFYKLEDGEHTLTVKAWDTQNNSAESTVSFVVGSSPKLVLDKILCYPNPVSQSATFSFEHNAADRPLDVSVKVYSLNGSLVHDIEQTITPSGFRETGVKWEAGDVMQGVYIYRVTIKDEDGNVASKSDRVVVIK